MKPGVALASYASSLGPIKSDRSESSVTCRVYNRTCSLDGQCSQSVPRSCWCTHRSSPCKTAHPPMVGVSDHSLHYVCKHCPGYGVSGAAILRGNQVEYRISPRYGWGKHRTHSALSGSVSFSVAASSFSWCSMYRSWISGELSLGQLREFSRDGRAGKFFSVSCARRPLEVSEVCGARPSGHFFVWSWLIYKFLFVFTSPWLGNFFVPLIGSDFMRSWSHAVRCRLRRVHLRARAALQNQPRLPRSRGEPMAKDLRLLLLL